MSEKYNTLGSRIKELRQSLKLSQVELAQRLHCTQAALSQYESGNREPGLQELVQIALELNTSTDYLLGITHIKTANTNVKMIGNYLGLSEESITILHNQYYEYKEKIEKDYVQSEVLSFWGTKPGDETYEEDFEHILKRAYLDLNDYMKFLNEFICSSTFKLLIRCLCNNLFLERNIYDMLRVTTRKYEQIESSFLESDITSKVFALVEDSEDYLNQYTLNVFEAQNTMLKFIQEFTRLEIVKELEYTESFYRKLCFFLYDKTHSMHGKGTFSFEELDEAIKSDVYKIAEKATKILDTCK